MTEKPIDWPALILKLRGPPQRLTLGEIAKRVGVHYMTVFKLQSRLIRCPSYEVGAKLIALEAKGRQVVTEIEGD